MGHLSKERDIRFLETMLIIKALITVANALNGAKDSDGLNDMVNDFKKLIYPELAHEVEDKAKRTAKILEQEHAKGPLRVQAQDYDRKRRKKRR
jgi:hypothetical protein